MYPQQFVSITIFHYAYHGATCLAISIPYWRSNAT